MANTPNTQPNKVQQKERKLLLSSLFVDAPVRIEPEEPSKIVIAGMKEAKSQKEYPDTFFGRAMSICRGELSTMFKAGLFFILFTLPFILILTLASGTLLPNNFETFILGGSFNFMSDIGIGYPGGGDSIAVSVSRLFWEVKQPIVMMLAGAGIIASIGMAGSFYVAKRSYFQNYYKKTARTFFMGIAKYWWKFLLTATIGILVALAMGTSLLYVLSQQALGSVSIGAYFGVVLSFLFGVPLLVIPMVMISLFASYQLTFAQTFKNAIVLIVNCPLMVIIVGLVSAVPLLALIAGSTIAAIIYLLMAVFGFNLCALCWTAMANRGMTKCSNMKATEIKKIAQIQKQKGGYAKSNGVAVVGSVNKEKKPQAKQQYQNPKKKKSK